MVCKFMKRVWKSLAFPDKRNDSKPAHDLEYTSHRNKFSGLFNIWIFCFISGGNIAYKRCT